MTTKRILGEAAALLSANIVFMYLFSLTPLAGINSILFGIPIVGVLVYGAMLSGGEHLARKGLKNRDKRLSIVGLVLLQAAYTLFGAGALRLVPEQSRIAILGGTGFLTVALTSLIAVVVWTQDLPFENADKYAGYSFLAVIGLAVLGTFQSAFLLLAFLFAMLGFVLRLVHELWEIRQGSYESVHAQAVGVYVATAGVFVHILRLLIRAREQ